MKTPDPVRTRLSQAFEMAATVVSYGIYLAAVPAILLYIASLAVRDQKATKEESDP